MDELQVFSSDEFGQVRTAEIDGEPWLVGKDVAAALGYERPTDAARKHVDEEDRGVAKIETPSGVQQMTIINESGLYSLVLSSKLPGAKRFKRWVTAEVLPAVRRHGAYMTPETIEKALLSPDFIIRLASQLKEEMEARREAESMAHMLAITNRQQQPMVDYFKDCVERNTLTSLRETAKLLKVKEKTMIRFLLENKYLFRSPSGKLLPHGGRPMDLFEVKEANDPERHWSGVQTLVTPMGRETLRLLLRGQPESGMWGRPTSRQSVKDLTPAEEAKLEAYYIREARRTAKKRRGGVSD